MHIDFSRVIQHSIRELKHAGDCVLDGEMEVFSNGIPSFSSLAVREQQIQKARIDFLSKDLPASYMVFDILYLGQESLMDRPLIERKSILKEELQESDVVTIVDYLPEHGESFYKAALGMGLEGIMAKKLDSTYQQGVRSKDWVKIKKQIIGHRLAAIYKILYSLFSIENTSWQVFSQRCVGGPRCKQRGMFPPTHKNALRNLKHP